MARFFRRRGVVSGGLSRRTLLRGTLNGVAVSLALPPLEVDFSALPAGLAPVLSFESKTEPDSPYWTDIKFRKADLADEEREAMEAHARTMFARIGLKDYGRFDFRRGADGVIKLMEVNPNPAWANDGKFAFMAGFAGHDYPAMLNLILEAAQARLAGGG